MVNGPGLKRFPGGFRWLALRFREGLRRRVRGRHGGCFQGRSHGFSQGKITNYSGFSQGIGYLIFGIATIFDSGFVLNVHFWVFILQPNTKCPLLGIWDITFKYLLEVNIPNSWVMLNLDIYQPLFPNRKRLQEGTRREIFHWKSCFLWRFVEIDQR